MATATSLRSYFMLEARHAPLRAPVIAAIAGAAIVAFTHALLPLLPAVAIDLMKRGFLLEDMAGVFLINDFMAVYFAAFFVGASGLLPVVVTAREEHRLELLLAKPIRASDFLAARTYPVIGAALAVGAFTSAACAVAIAPLAGSSVSAAGSSVSAAGALGGGLFLTAIVVVQLGALSAVFVRMRDSFHALLVACAAWFLLMMPTATLLYRPDVFEGREALTRWTVMASLIWNDAAVAWLGPIALAVAVLISLALVRAAGALLERTDAA
jgi:hypothetical protein